MNILVATNHLIQTGGTENYTFSIIMQLKKMGHNVEYFTFKKGNISNFIEKEGVKFKSKRIYDLIIANHKPVIEHLCQFGCIVQTCHGKFFKLESPSKYADKIVTISEEVNNYVESLNFKSTVIKNGIDCSRFSSSNEINNELEVVLSLCQSDEANNFIKECCEDINLDFISVNKFKENIWEVEKIINKADLVVGIGRSLYDSMACGRAVISFDKRSYSDAIGDGYLNRENIHQSISYNCSGRYSQNTFTKKTFIEELKKYKKSDGEYFREFALNELNVESQTAKYLNLFSFIQRNSINSIKITKRIRRKILN